MEKFLESIKGIGLDRFLIALAVLAICLVATRYLMRMFARLLGRMQKIDPSLHSMLTAVMRVLLVFLSVMIAVNVIGIPITSFLALFSVVGIAVSLAVQNVLANLAGGVILLASKPFTLGDFVETDGIMGTVKEIGFLHTRMETFDGKMIFVPNDVLQTSKLINYSTSGTRRIDLTVSASYANTPDQVRAAVMQAIEETPGILPDPAPMVVLENYGEHAILYAIRAWAKAADFGTARYGLNERLYTAFRQNGVEMTYPHINVHMQ